MDREEIKLNARKMRDENIKTFWSTYIVVIAISFVLSLAIELLFKKNTTIYSCLTILSSLFTATLSVGFTSCVMKMVRGESFESKDVFKYINNIIPIILIALLTTIICALWSILFIIPGIIAAIGYSMVYFIYIDNPDLSPADCLSKSKELMDGYKMDYFIFSLSFLGWIILSILTFGILLIWVIPYINMAQVMYYDELKKLKEKK